MASEKKRDKKQQMGMNWQAEQAKKQMQSERPEVQVRENEMKKNLMEAVQFLRSERNGEKKEHKKWVSTGKRNTDFLTIAQVKERTHIDIANDTYRGFLGLRSQLEQSPNIEWNGSDRLRYKPEFDEIQNSGQLRELITKFEFGIKLNRLEDCYARAKIADDIQELEKNGHICVVTLTPDQQILYPLSKRFRLEVSKDVVRTWNEVSLPIDAELERELKQQGLEDAASRATNKVYKRPIQKKPKKARRGQHTVNKHLLDTKLR